MTEKDPDILSLDEIERIEKLTLRWIFQAVLDFGMEASAFCYYSYTQSKDIFFYARKRGVRFMLKVLPFHLVYYLYSSMSFAYCWITHKTATFGSLLFNGKLK